MDLIGSRWTLIPPTRASNFMDATSRNIESTARIGRKTGRDADCPCASRGRIPDEEAVDFYIKPSYSTTIYITRNNSKRNDLDCRSEHGSLCVALNRATYSHFVSLFKVSSSCPDFVTRIPTARRPRKTRLDILPPQRERCSRPIDRRQWLNVCARLSYEQRAGYIQYM